MIECDVVQLRAMLCVIDSSEYVTDVLTRNSETGCPVPNPERASLSVGHVQVVCVNISRKENQRAAELNKAQDLEDKVTIPREMSYMNTGKWMLHPVKLCSKSAIPRVINVVLRSKSLSWLSTLLAAIRKYVVHLVPSTGADLSVKWRLQLSSDRGPVTRGCRHHQEQCRRFSLAGLTAYTKKTPVFGCSFVMPFVPSSRPFRCVIRSCCIPGRLPPRRIGTSQVCAGSSTRAEAWRPDGVFGRHDLGNRDQGGSEGGT